MGKIVFFDIDGTLVTPKNKLPNSNKEAIHELKEKGWNVDLSATTVEEAKATILAALKE